MEDFQFIFKAIVGSRAYGTNLPTSDIDYKGIYQQPFNDILSFKYKDQYQIGKDESYYEIKRFIELLKTANPTVLELLYSPEDCILINTNHYKFLSNHRDKFLTKQCLNSFGGYAVQQIKKAKGLDKKMNWEKNRIERKTPLDFCFIFNEGITIPLTEFLSKNNMEQHYCGLAKVDHFRDAYSLYYDYQMQYGSISNREVTPMGYSGLIGEDSNDLRLSSIPKYATSLGIVYYNKDAYTIHCKEFNQYQSWLKERNEERYIDTVNHDQKIDGKNLLHCRRLLDIAAEIVTDRTIKVRRPNADYLLSIRKGEVNLDYLIKKAEEDIEKTKTI